MQEEEEQQEAERDRQRRQYQAERATSIEQRQRMEEHLEEAVSTSPGLSRKRKRTANGNQIKYFNESVAHIPSCLEEEYPKFAQAAQEFPPLISPENLRSRCNDYQQRVNWYADRSPCGICDVGGLFNQIR
jgi:hypothetical protein